MWKIHPDLGTPKRCFLSAMRIDCEHHLLKQFSDVECWTYASPAMMKSISIKSAVAKLSFHIYDGCLRQAEVLNKVVWNVFVLFLDQTLS